MNEQERVEYAKKNGTLSTLEGQLDRDDEVAHHAHEERTVSHDDLTWPRHEHAGRKDLNIYHSSNPQVKPLDALSDAIGIVMEGYAADSRQKRYMAHLLDLTRRYDADREKTMEVMTDTLDARKSRSLTESSPTTEEQLAHAASVAIEVTEKSLAAPAPNATLRRMLYRGDLENTKLRAELDALTKPVPT